MTDVRSGWNRLSCYTLMLYFLHVTVFVLLRAGIWFVLQVHM